MIYKLLRAPEWESLRSRGSFAGAPVDLKDGYIHFSTAGQMAETARKHFAGVEGLVLAEVDPALLPKPPVWEPSRGGQLFPHLYGELPLAAVSRSWPLPLGADGRHAFPELPGLREPDWTAWAPKERASLLFVIKGGDILLIHKKRGLGAGKVNGPGGRLEPGESPADCARRETREEVGVTPLGLTPAGELHFQFVDGYGLHCVVFTAEDVEGTLVETDEAKPFWAKTSAIPYENMWTDDRHWVPWMLERRPFKGYFQFDGDRMLSGRVVAG